MRAEFLGRWFLPHGVAHRGSAVERSWSLQQLLVARSVSCGQGGTTGFVRFVCGFSEIVSDKDLNE